MLIFALAFGGGAAAAARWLPELADGPTGTLAFFVSCGLSGAAVGIAGLHIYGTVRSLETAGGSGILLERKPDILASGLTQILFDSGVLFAAAAVVFLLAPRGPARPANGYEAGPPS